MILALPGHPLTLPIAGSVLLRARRELGADGDPEAVGLGLLALSLPQTQGAALVRLAGGWSLALVGADALDVLSAARAPAALLALARAASSACLAPVVAAAPAEAPPVAPPLLPDGMTFDGLPWERASLDGAHPGASEEQRARRGLVREAIVAHREGRLAEWASGRAGVHLPG